MPQPKNPQDWNRYSYVRNNPVRHTDSSGHCIDGLTTAACYAISVGLNTVSDIAIDYGISRLTGEDFDLAWSASTNLALNAATAGFGGKIAKAGKIGGLIAKYGDNIAGFVAKHADDIGKHADEVIDGVKGFVGAVCSFSEDTPVATITGFMPIANIITGTLVLGWDESTNTLGYFPVIAVWGHEDPVVVELILDDERITTTPEHPFFVESEGWLAAEALPVGTKVRKSNGYVGIVRSNFSVARTQTMWNLTVAQAHTFHVGDGEWLVHNQCFPGTITAQLSTRAKDAYRNEARRIWEKKTGSLAGATGMEIHHRTPLEWAHLFPNADPNRAANLVGMAGGPGQAHKQISEAWRLFREGLNGRAPTAAEIMAKALELDRLFGDAMRALP